VKPSREELVRLSRKIKLLLLDVDGVLTDGRIRYDDRGRESKGFHVQDGQGLQWLMGHGIQVGWVSARVSGAVERRAKELGVSFLFQGVKDKTVVFEGLIQTTGLKPDQVAFVGDDFVDVKLLRKVGLSICVADGHPSVQKAVKHVTRAPGGLKAVREVAELLLKAQGKWGSVLNEYGLK
jgi:3-deoxy-D-manno-octulosonate 8-phosphate phosphatase (KDO 8-P phosphatase)